MRAAWICLGIALCIEVAVEQSCFAQAADPAAEPSFYFRDVRIGITPEQEAKIQTIDARHKNLFELRGDVQTKRVEAGNDVARQERKLDIFETVYEAEILTVLTPEQRRQWREARFEAQRNQVEADVSYLVGVSAYLPLMARAEQLVIYEGLPHQRAEEKLLIEEIRTKKTVVIADFHFYDDPLPPRDADERRFRKLATDYRSFSAYRGPRFCGGYHPDWCLEWRDKAGNQLCRLSICLGCHEAHFTGPRGELWVDIEDAAYETLRDMLSLYAKNRPKNRA